jgi:hypothetical protein
VTALRESVISGALEKGATGLFGRGYLSLAVEFSLANGTAGAEVRNIRGSFSAQSTASMFNSPSRSSNSLSLSSNPA